MTNNFECYYLFYDRPNKRLMQLNLLSNSEQIKSIRCVAGKFKLFNKLYDKEEKFIEDLNAFNDKMALEYYERFKIYAPYKFEHKLFRSPNALETVKHYTEIRLDSISFTAYDGGKLPLIVTRGEYPYFRDIHRSYFDAEVMVMFHYGFLGCTVFRGGYDYAGNYYLVNCGTSTYVGRVVKDESDGTFFLQFRGGCTNGYVFEYYNIKERSIARYLPNRKWRGDWPQTTEDNLFAIMQYINHNYISFVKQGLEITEDSVKSNNKVYPFKQSTKGTWYLSGNIEHILKMFNVDSVKSLRKIMDTHFGTKKRFGIFPECESKEELVKFIKILAQFK